MWGWEGPQPERRREIRKKRERRMDGNVSQFELKEKAEEKR